MFVSLDDSTLSLQEWPGLLMQLKFGNEAVDVIEVNLFPTQGFGQDEPQPGISGAGIEAEKQVRVVEATVAKPN